MRVVAWTFRPDAEWAAKHGVQYVDYEQLLRTSDVVSLHLKLTRESTGMLGREQIAAMKPGALVVNVGRGALLDSAALVDALNDGRLGGAGLDVFDAEPLPPDAPILRCDNVVLTPHVADVTPEGMEMLNQGAVENVLAYLSGNPINLVTN
jgi:D-3-phosphoglycerate dehydrogenase